MDPSLPPPSNGLRHLMIIENRMPNKALQSKEKGRRPIGRPRTRWMDQAQENMEAKGADWRGNSWLREKFEEMDRNGRVGARRAAEVETSNDDDEGMIAEEPQVVEPRCNIPIRDVKLSGTRLSESSIRGMQSTKYGLKYYNYQCNTVPLTKNFIKKGHGPHKLYLVRLKEEKRIVDEQKKQEQEDKEKIKTKGATMDLGHNPAPQPVASPMGPPQPVSPANSTPPQLLGPVPTVTTEPSTHSSGYQSLTQTQFQSLQDTIVGLQKAMATMEEKGLQNDPRYSQLAVLHTRQLAKLNMESAQGPNQNAVHDTQMKNILSPNQLQQLRVQIMAYRLLARNQPLTSQLALAVQGKRYDQNFQPRVGGNDQAKQQDSWKGWRTWWAVVSGCERWGLGLGHLDIRNLVAMERWSCGNTCLGAIMQQPIRALGSGGQPPNNTPISGQTAPSSQAIGQTSTSAQSLNGQAIQAPHLSSRQLPQPLPQTSSQQPTIQPKQNRVTSVAKPAGLDPIIILQERESRLVARVAHRIEELDELSTSLAEDTKIKAEIELRALRLLNFQRQLRYEVVGCQLKDTVLETASNIKTYKRTKRQGLREARATEKLEKQQKLEAERKKRQKHQTFNFGTRMLIQKSAEDSVGKGSGSSSTKKIVKPRNERKCSDVYENNKRRNIFLVNISESNL
ncbi:unnamed protein product, partial [Timema podura]|nr:unnamed protein product [Timema podura]